MRELWSTELTEEETDRLLKKAASEVKRRKLESPAILMAEMHKPLAGIGSQAAVMLSPILVPFFGFENVDDYSRLFSKRENFERFIRLLEQDAQPDEGPDSVQAGSEGEKKEQDSAAQNKLKIEPDSKADN